MINFPIIAGRLAGFVSLAAFAPYLWGIFQGRTKPNRATWLIWTVVGLLLASSYYATGARHTIWAAVSYVLGPLVIALLSLKYGVGGWTPLDRGCLIGAGLSTLVWWFFKSPLAVLCLNLLIDLFGALPTLRKVYEWPDSEDTATWLLFLIGNTLNLFALESWKFSLIIYPAYMFVLSSLMTMLILTRRSVRQQA